MKGKKCRRKKERKNVEEERVFFCLVSCFYKSAACQGCHDEHRVTFLLFAELLLQLALVAFGKELE